MSFFTQHGCRLEWFSLLLPADTLSLFPFPTKSTSNTKLIFPCSTNPTLRFLLGVWHLKKKKTNTWIAMISPRHKSHVSSTRYKWLFCFFFYFLEPSEYVPNRKGDSSVFFFLLPMSFFFCYLSLQKKNIYKEDEIYTAAVLSEKGQALHLFRTHKETRDTSRGRGKRLMMKKNVEYYCKASRLKASLFTWRDVYLPFYLMLFHINDIYTYIWVWLVCVCVCVAKFPFVFW